MKRNYLTLEERWAMDIEMAKDGGTMIVSTPQCEICKYWIKGNAEQCEKYSEIKPKDTLRCKKECPEFMHKEILEIDLNSKEKGRFFGGIFGFCVGDALGVPVEFTSRAEREKDPVQEMRAYGTYHQYFGTWSDDSSLSLCLMDSLKEGYNLNDIADKFCKYYYESYFTPYDKIFDIGNTTVQAIERMKSGIEPVKCGGSSVRDNGNGSLMRILPLAFYLLNKPKQEKIKIIEDISSLTHAHKRSKLGCIIYVEYAINLIRGYNKLESYTNTQNFILANLTHDYSEELVNYRNILEKDISMITEDHIQSSGYVVHTLEAALWSFMTSVSYKETIFKAINLGDDTDTIGAITGGLAGIYYGVEKIPNNWIQCLARKNDIYKLCEQFLIVL